MAMKVSTAKNNSYGKVVTSVKKTVTGAASMSNNVKKTASRKTNTSMSGKKAAPGKSSISTNVKKTISRTSVSTKVSASSNIIKNTKSNSTKSKSTAINTAVSNTKKGVTTNLKNNQSNTVKKVDTLESKTKSVSNQKNVLVNASKVMSDIKGNLTKGVQSSLSKQSISDKIGKSVSNAVKASVINGSYVSASSWWKLDKSKIAVPPENMSYEETLEYRFEHAVDPNTKKIYLKYCRQIAIQTNTYTGHSHYEPFMNVIKYNKEKDAENRRGVGCTYFHEVGHLIDDKSDWNGETSSDWSYDFYDKLKKDVDNYVKKVKKENGLTTREEAVAVIKNWLEDDPDNKNGVSDLLAGLTKYEIRGKWKHEEKYYTKRNIENEAFAHFFEAGMASDDTKLNYIKQVFPTAFKEYQKMLTDDLKQPQIKYGY